MKNVIVVPSFPQECGDDSLTFVDCSNGKILKVVNLTELWDDEPNPFHEDTIYGEQLEFYIRRGTDITEETLKDSSWHYHEECHIKPDDGQDFVIFDTAEQCIDVSRAEKFLPVGEYRVDDCEIVATLRVNVFGETAEEAAETDPDTSWADQFPCIRKHNIWKIKATRLSYTEPYYHKDEDKIWDNAKAQEVPIPDFNTWEERRDFVYDFKNIAKIVAEINNWNILTILWS